MFKIHQPIKIDFFSSEISAHDKDVSSSKVFEIRLFHILSSCREIAFDNKLQNTVDRDRINKIHKKW